jgi:hypothetical protein
MSGGGGGGTLWIFALVGGLILCAAAAGLEAMHAPSVLIATCLAVGGLSVVFGSCEAMIKSVEGLAERLKWNQFVAGTIAGLASNLPEVVMLGFVIAKEPRVAFVIVVLTLHVSAMAFGIYSGLLPRDEAGHARMPEPMVKLSTDLYACAAGAMLVTGFMMIVMRVFQGEGAALDVTDLYVIGGCLLFVEVVAVYRLVKDFSGEAGPTPVALTEAAADSVGPAPALPSFGADDEEPAEAKADEAKPPKAKPAAPAMDEGECDPPGWGVIGAFGLLGVLTSIVGGHAVGEFADLLVGGLKARGYSEMVGAIVISIFACSGAYLMIATAHVKGMYDLALANVSGQVVQVPFVVLPISLILIGVFAQLGIVDASLLPAGGGALAIDLETTSVVLMAFPPLLILWKSIQDDGSINWLETASMIALFGLTIYFLAQHG